MFPCTQFAGAIFPVLNVFVCLISPIVNCSDPTSPGNGSIGTYQNTTEGAEIFFRCNPGFVPPGRMIAVCASDGRWSPDPVELRCIGE